MATNPEVQVSAQENPKLEGISGWLLLPLIQLIVGPFFIAFAWTHLLLHPALMPSFAFHGTSKDLIFGLLGAMIVLISLAKFFFGLFCLTRFLGKNHATPRMMIGWYALIIMGAALLMSQIAVITRNIGSVLTSDPIFLIVMSAILIVYFTTSVRVKNTFVK
jgi:hypothetical protein